MTTDQKQPVYLKFDNLWSFHNSQTIEGILHRLKELKMQGQYYSEINMPEIEKIITGLQNDIGILKRDKVNLINQVNELKKK